MATRKSLKEFYIGARITLSTDCVISAASMEEALEKAKTLDIHDFVTLLGNHNDSSLEIDSIFVKES